MSMNPKMLTKCEKEAPVKVEPVNKNRLFDFTILLWCLNHEQFDLYKRGYTAELPVVGGLLEPNIFIMYLVFVVFCLYLYFFF